MKPPYYTVAIMNKLIFFTQVPVSLPNSYMGYGAVVPDGYGVSYNLQVFRINH